MTSQNCSIIDVCKINDDCDNKLDMKKKKKKKAAMSKPRSLPKVGSRLFAWVHFLIARLTLRLTLENLGAVAVLLVFIFPHYITYIIIYPIFRLVFGTLYPAYASYKAVRTKNVKEYVKWMMYWIVFALFTCAETFTDVFFSFWFPFYYEIKIILVLWLLSPATKGSSILYRRFVHPALIRREAEIDDALARATEQGYTAVLHLGTRGVNYATTVLMQTAIKNLPNVILNPPSPSLPESQSDPAISSLVNKSSKKRNPTKDSVDGSTSRRSKSQNDNNVARSSSMDISSDSDNNSIENITINTDDDSVCSLDDFKETIETVPKYTRNVKRKKNVNPRKKSLRSYGEINDEIDD